MRYSASAGILLVLVSWMPFTASAEDLTLGWEDWRPYQYLSDEGVATGLDIDLLTAVFDEQGRTLEYVELPWKRLLGNIESGRTDLAPSASRTPERETYAYFSDPYRSESAALYIRAEDREKYRFSSLKDIIGTDFSLAVTRGYYYGEEFDALMKTEEFRRHVQEVNDNQLAQRQLARGRVDGFLEDPVAAVVELELEGLLDSTYNAMLVYSDDIHVMFSKATMSEADVAGFNASLAAIRDSGVYQEIMERYGQ